MHAVGGFVNRLSLALTLQAAEPYTRISFLPLAETRRQFPVAPFILI